MKSFNLLSTHQGFLNTCVCLKKTVKKGPITLHTRTTNVVIRALYELSSGMFQHKPVENYHSYPRMLESDSRGLP